MGVLIQTDPQAGSIQLPRSMSTWIVANHRSASLLVEKVLGATMN